MRKYKYTHSQIIIHTIARIHTHTHIHTHTYIYIYIYIYTYTPPNPGHNRDDEYPDRCPQSGHGHR